MAGSLGVIGLILTDIGIYGVIAYTVTSRTRGIGIRIVLGARTADVTSLVLRESVALTLIGAGIGVVLASLLSSVLAGFLLGIPPIDSITIAATIVLFAAAGLATCYVPDVARRTSIPRRR